MTDIQQYYVDLLVEQSEVANSEGYTDTAQELDNAADMMAETFKTVAELQSRVAFLEKALEQAQNFFYQSSIDGAICYRGKDHHPEQVPELAAYLQSRRETQNG